MGIFAILLLFLEICIYVYVSFIRLGFDKAVTFKQYRLLVCSSQKSNIEETFLIKMQFVPVVLNFHAENCYEL